jgi:hypothetical protein
MTKSVQALRDIPKRLTRYEREAPKDAQTAWMKLSKSKRLAVAAELVVSRGPELRLAFPATLGIAYGFRSSGENTGDGNIASRRQRAAKRVVDQSEVCVTFMVSRKKKASSLSQTGRNLTIPSFLLAYCTLGKARKICAVPTNVECKRNYSIKPHTSRKAILVDDGRITPPVAFERGVVTCVVNLPDGSGPYVMGCYHVLAFSDTARASIRGSDSRPNDAMPGAEFCKVSRYCGRLVPGGRGFSFDSALGKVTNAEALAAVASQGPSFAQGDSGVPGTAKIVLPDGSVSLRLVNVWHGFDLIQYLPFAPQPVQARVVEWTVESAGAVQKGDSGSPIVRSNDDDFLLGMYIGGDGIRRAFMLPAPEILDGQNYGVPGDLNLVSIP